MQQQQIPFGKQQPPNINTLSHTHTHTHTPPPQKTVVIQRFAKPEPNLQSVDVCDHYECQCVPQSKGQFKSNLPAPSEGKLRSITDEDIVQQRSQPLHLCCFVTYMSQTNMGTYSTWYADMVADLLYSCSTLMLCYYPGVYLLGFFGWQCVTVEVFAQVINYTLTIPYESHKCVQAS